ncbi:unnamed protein product, partial [marine sediment metagenome]
RLPRLQDIQGMTIERLPGLLELKGEVLNRVVRNKANRVRREAERRPSGKPRLRDLSRERFEFSRSKVWWMAVLKGEEL